MQLGDIVQGYNLDGKEIEGKLEKVLSSFSIAFVRTGLDNTQVALCDFNNIRTKEDN